MAYCYCLVSDKNTTYVGFSTNVDRRLRQHNCEIQGGAKATKGKTWRRILTVGDFPSHTSALQFEWKWKYLTRKTKGSTAVERRCHALITLLNSEKSTSNAEPFCSFKEPLTVLIEDSSVYPFLRDKEMLYGIVLE